LGSLLSGLFLILSIPVDLANISTIAGHSGLRPSGYFHLVTLLSAFNIVFFILNFLVLALEALTLYELVPQVIFKILSVNAWISKALYDLIVGLVGLQILLLCVMTMELRFDLSRHFYFKPKGQTCMRVFLTLLAFAMVIIALAVVSLIRTTDIFWDTTADDNEEKPLISKLVIYVIYLMTFTCLPSFILVIVGVINCVSQWNSTRLNPVEIRLAQKLDKRYCVIGMILVCATVAKLIIDMALEINAYGDSKILFQVFSHLVSRLIDFLLLLIPMTTTCVFGKRCCCWCCCNACQPPLDELE